jgi:hypothetical protein
MTVMTVEMFETFNRLIGTVTSFDDMVGKIVTKVTCSDSELCFYFTNKNYVKFYHQQNCCESVYIDDICGDLQDLVGSPLILAEEVNADCPGKNQDDEWGGDDSYTWTFYRFATNKGDVTVKWYGTSNGYYSESVDIKVVTGDDDNDDDEEYY